MPSDRDARDDAGDITEQPTGRLGSSAAVARQREVWAEEHERLALWWQRGAIAILRAIEREEEQLAQLHAGAVKVTEEYLAKREHDLQLLRDEWSHRLAESERHDQAARLLRAQTR